VILAEIDPAGAAEALGSIVRDKAVDPDVRFEAAARLAGVSPPMAAVALSVIMSDATIDPDIRAEAAHQLTEID
jgi:hypothetical protein